MKYLVIDTCIVLHILRGKQQGLKCIEAINQYDSNVAIIVSVVTKAELEALKDISLDNLVKAFSVEKLSKSFFDEYKLHYQAFNSYLINSNFRSSAFGIEKQKDENAAEYKPIRDFVKKTLGRIVFLFFVQKKGWLAASTTKYVDGDTNFIMNLFQKSGANETFYPNQLCKLFFEALNTQRTGDLYTLHFKDGKKEVVCVPFLNGGLFEKEKFDY